jgi:alpha-L-fucosidase
MPGINPYPWQTDTSIGDWFYNRNWKFRPVSWTIHMLVDIVSKNGNLLLNIVQRPDGSLDPEVEQALQELAAWVQVHGEAIYGTRPWLVYGEGAVKAKGGHFKEDFAYNSKDVRFTTKGRTLYAIALGWPEDGQLVVRSLAQPAGKIKTVSLLGYRGKLAWTQTGAGLEIKLPSQKVSSYTCALKIQGQALTPVPLTEETTVVSADADGNFALSADTAELHGDQINTEEKGGQTNIGFWDRSDEWVSWRLKLARPGTFAVTLSAATVHPDAELAVETNGRTLVTKIPETGDWAKFGNVEFGTIQLGPTGEQSLKLRAVDPSKWKAINVRSVKLVRRPD